MSPNFVLLDPANSEVASLISAMLRAREAVGRCSSSHPMEPTTEEWWADVLADPRARRRARRDAAGSTTHGRSTGERLGPVMAVTECRIAMRWVNRFTVP
jgi:hypothetical protein